MSSVSHALSGLDRLLVEPALRPSGRLGLLTHFAAVTPDLHRGVDALVAAGIRPDCLISPEHGYWGTGQAGVGNDEDVDRATGLPVLDAYGVHGEALDRLLGGAGIDHVVVDLQDAGCRFYTYMWSMVDVMASCGRLGLPVTVLDRPAPLAAVATGPGLDPACASFVGRLGVPLRHGERLGGIARIVAAHHLDPAPDLHVVEAPGADGSAPWVAPSPNMPTRTTLALYPGTGLLEGTVYSEGRGTTAPFQVFGAPWCGPELAAHLRELELPGVAFREAAYRPTHADFAGERVHGAQVHMTVGLDRAGTDTALFDPLAVGHAIISALAALHPDRPLWREQVPGRPPFIDLLWGSSAFREGIEAGADLPEILAASPAPVEMVA
ncbi:exo-beta-N-acetylmuramidase NamZ family protein [Brachybacterium sp. AOP43-C2-M15]|uniref:exo-beta-N-acetylmuramidase NamZ family protein n=1 Tax=Brachybacterium sp. AOP43-C2-M15 TaxID=3457661 RepID=UPI0040345E4D